jgi:hypothetical protein
MSSVFGDLRRLLFLGDGPRFRDLDGGLLVGHPTAGSFISRIAGQFALMSLIAQLTVCLAVSEPASHRVALPPKRSWTSSCGRWLPAARTPDDLFAATVAAIDAIAASDARAIHARCCFTLP